MDAATRQAMLREIDDLRKQERAYREAASHMNVDPNDKAHLLDLAQDCIKQRVALLTLLAAP